MKTASVLKTSLLLLIFASAMIILGGCKDKTASETDTNTVAAKEKVAEVNEPNSVAKVEVPAAEAITQTHCPVMGGPINKDIFVEYKGQKVYFCCQGCVEEFNKEPEKYMTKLSTMK